jgi:glucose-1-phosphate adenylyltransferase
MFPYDDWEYGIVQLKDVDAEKRDPSTVVAVILGGGAGTRLFPLTKRRAKPAVSFSILLCYEAPT